MNGSLKRTMAVFLIISVALTACFLLVSSSIYLDALRLNTGQSVEIYLSEQSKLLSDEMQVIKTALYSLANKQEIADYLVKDHGYRAANIKKLMATMNDIPNYVPSIIDIALITADDHYAATTNKSDMSGFLKRYQMIEANATQRSSELVCLYNVTDSGSDYLLSMAIPAQSSGKTGYIIAFCTADSLFGGLSIAKREFVVTNQDTILYSRVSGRHTALEIVNLASARSADDYGEYVSFPVKIADLNVFIASPLTAQNDGYPLEMARWNFITLAIFILIELIMFVMVYKMIVAPISSISRQSQLIPSSAAFIDNPTPGRNEINLLVENINAMVSRTNQLTQEVSDAKVRLMELSITNLESRNMFLQAQINPHFLYNMLECICGMAVSEGNIAIREMTCALSALYRYCLKSPESTLGEELDCVRLYEGMIRQRYAHGYRIDIRVHEALYMLPLPRMTLEPLVENAVQHGFVRGSDKEFFVEITAEYKGGRLDIAIADNGCGMPDDMLARVNSRLESALSAGDQQGDMRIGLYNVGARLALTYGANSGLRLEINELGGVTARLIVFYA